MGMYTFLELRSYLLKAYPNAVIISSDKLLELHNGLSDKQYVLDSMSALEEAGDEYICYYLPSGSYGSQPGQCCNGIRFGKEGDYISLLHIDEPVEDVA